MARYTREPDEEMRNVVRIASPADTQSEAEASAALPTDTPSERTGARAELALSELKIGLEHSRGEMRFFGIAAAAALCVAIVIISIVAAPLIGSGPVAGAVTSVLSGLCIAIIKLYSSARKMVEKDHNLIFEYESMLAMIDLADSISDRNESDRAKRKIVEKVLDIT